MVRLHLMEEVLTQALNPFPELRRRQQLHRRRAHSALERHGGYPAQHLRHSNEPEAWKVFGANPPTFLRRSRSTLPRSWQAPAGKHFTAVVPLSRRRKYTRASFLPSTASNCARAGGEMAQAPTHSDRLGWRRAPPPAAWNEAPCAAGQIPRLLPAPPKGRRRQRPTSWSSTRRAGTTLTPWPTTLASGTPTWRRRACERPRSHGRRSPAPGRAAAPALARSRATRSSDPPRRQLAAGAPTQGTARPPCGRKERRPTLPTSSALSESGGAGTDAVYRALWPAQSTPRAPGIAADAKATVTRGCVRAVGGRM